MPVVILIRRVLCVVFFSVLLLGQRSTETGVPQPATAPAPQAMQQPASQSNDGMSQMRDDLNKMESLNMNMSSEIEFLHDQNLQILLRTNSQMWTILIRDLRRQVQLEEQHKAVATPSR